MGGFDPASAAMFALNLVNQQRQAKAQERSAQAQANHEISQLRQAQAIRDRQRREGLNRALATQRARFGAQGVGAGGSARAVLDGLNAESTRAGADEASGVASRVADINANVLNLRRRNLLERQTLINDRIFDEVRKRVPVLSLLD